MLKRRYLRRSTLIKMEKFTTIVKSSVRRCLTRKKCWPLLPRPKNPKIALTRKKLAYDVDKQKSLLDLALDKRSSLEYPAKEPSIPLRRSPRISPRRNYTDDNDFDELSDTDLPPSKSAKDQPFINSPRSIHASSSELETQEDAGLITGPTTTERDEFALVFIPSEVTERDLQYQRKLLNAMEKAFSKSSGKRIEYEYPANFQMPDRFTQPGKDKVEIFAGCGIYLPSYRKSTIEARAIDSKTGLFLWIDAIKDVLLDIYGDCIGDFSAKGKRQGSRPSINDKVYDGLYSWINSKENLENPATDKDFAKAINDFCYNKRKYRKNLRGRIFETNITNSTKGERGTKRKTKDSYVQLKQVLDPDDENEPSITDNPENSLSPTHKVKIKHPKMDGKNTENKMGKNSPNLNHTQLNLKAQSSLPPSPIVFPSAQQSTEMWNYSQSAQPAQNDTTCDSYQGSQNQQWYPALTQPPYYRSQGYYPQEQYWINRHQYGVNNYQQYPYQQQGQPGTYTSTMPPSSHTFTPSSYSNSDHGNQLSKPPIPAQLDTSSPFDSDRQDVETQKLEVEGCKKLTSSADTLI